MTTEWTQRTALSTFTLVPRRGSVLTAKLGAAVAVAVGAALSTGAAAVAATVVAGAHSGQQVRWTGMATGLAGAVLGGVCFMLLGVALGVLLQHSAAALVAYLLAPGLVTLAGTALVGDRVEWVAATVAIIRLEDFDLHGAVGPTVTALALWVLVPLTVGIVRWQRREVP